MTTGNFIVTVDRKEVFSKKKAYRFPNNEDLNEIAKLLN